MAGRYAKPEGQKVSRAKTPGFVDLPVRREGPTPELPEWRHWLSATHEWWAHLWTRPQAVMWDQTGSTLWTLACLVDDLIGAQLGEAPDAGATAKVAAEMRQHEDRHGLNPKALMQLHWRVPPAEASSGDPEGPEATEEPADRRTRLRVA